MDGSAAKKRKRDSLLSAVSEFRLKVQEALNTAPKVLKNEEETVLNARICAIRNAKEIFTFLAEDLEKLCTDLTDMPDDGKAMDALCRTIISVIDETHSFIEDLSAVASVLPLRFQVKDMTDVVVKNLDQPDATSGNVVIKNSTGIVSRVQPRAGSSDQSLGDETQLERPGGTQDAVAKLFSSCNDIKKDATDLENQALEYVRDFVCNTQEIIKNFSDKYGLNIGDLVKTIVKEALDNWENKECMEKLRQEMELVIGITSRAPIVRAEIESLIESHGNLVGVQESQVLDSRSPSPVLSHQAFK